MKDIDELLAKAKQPAAEALRLHPFYRGKVQTMLKVPVGDLQDFAVWYTPGVAASCRAICDEPEQVYEQTNKANSVAIVSDGTRVLGLGDIGPEAGLPVMEGKALLFKYLGGVDAVPLCIDTKDTEGIIEVVRALQPSFGGINLEDIAQPKCFEILDRLRSEMDIPVWHDDQQGTATVVLAGLINALKVVGKDMGNIRLAMIGAGAANVATYRLLRRFGVDPTAVIVCDSTDTLHRDRADIERRRAEYRDKWAICLETNPDQITGGIESALQGADACIAFSAGGIIQPDWIGTMSKDAIVFGCANPMPEIWPWDATAAGAKVVATGRSDFPNQVNNSLVFPAVFRGALDVRARTISDEMAIAAAQALAAATEEAGIHRERIVPTMAESTVYVRVALATALKAEEQGLARVRVDPSDLMERASRMIHDAQAATALLMSEELIPRAPQ